MRLGAAYTLISKGKPMTTTKFTLPKNKSAYAMFPSEMRALIDGAVEAVREKPWAAVYHVVMDFRDMGKDSFRPAPTDEHIETINRTCRLMVTALLERLGTKAKPCSDSFQATVFMNSARKDHRRFAHRYCKKAGGEEAVSAKMEAWAKEHRDELETLDTGVMIRCGKIAGDGPKSLDATLDEWTEKARERFDTEGEVHPLAVGLDNDGSGLMLTTKPFDSVAKKRAFRQMAEQQFNECGLTRIVSVGEVWIGPGGPVRPCKSNERREAIWVAVSEGGKTVAATIPIERDMETGRGILGEAEKAGHAEVRDFTGM